MDAFEAEYGTEDTRCLFKGRPDRINWPKVAEQFSGFETVPYLWSMRFKAGIWYYGFDVASGCIWSKDAVKEIKLLATLRKPLLAEAK